jgi:hypothetical protein
MRSVGFTSLGDSVKGAQLAGEARRGDHVGLADGVGSGGVRRLGLRWSRGPDRGRRTSSKRRISHDDAGNRWIEAFALTEVLWLEARQGRPREALARYSDVIEIWYRGGDWANQWLSLRHVFGILVQLRAHLGAATLHGALSAAGAAYALPFEASDAEHLAALAADLRTQLGAAAFAAAVRRGATLNDAEIIGFTQDQIHALSG